MRAALMSSVGTLDPSTGQSLGALLGRLERSIGQGAAARTDDQFVG